ncbi:MAG: hypothetical protein KatS3mg104_2062 [Phycisphaerae bacterium]|jgi:hypothetical protein|nr:MAG: hypothetical protein KatS3mg104_2062 [Phycisphaerae bacterium]
MIFSEETHDTASPVAVSATETTDTLESESTRRFSTGSLLLGGLILFAVVGLALMHWRVQSDQTQTASDASKAINAFLGDGKKNLVMMQQVLNDTDKLVEHFRNFPAAAQVPLEDLNRNPFSDEQNPSRTAQPVEDADRKTRLNAAIQRVSNLKLQSIVYGTTTRSCMIDNRYRQEGETFDGIEIEQIHPAGVIVRYDGFRFELKVKN